METKYGDMGNSIREKHKARRGDFVLFADDDNWCATAHTGSCHMWRLVAHAQPLLLVCKPQAQHARRVLVWTF